MYPDFKYTQDEAMNMLKEVWPRYSGVLDRLTTSSEVQSRNFVIPLSEYRTLGQFEQRNNLYIQKVQTLLQQLLLNFQQEQQFSWDDVAIITSTSITGIAVPSLDARLMNVLPLRHDVLRVPLFGLGCLGGIGAINRTHALLQHYPDKLAIVMAAEACSLTFQFDDVSMANMVGSSLFADGAGVVLMAGPKHPLATKGKLSVLAFQSQFYPDTERIMGWDIGDAGFKLVLSGNVPDIVHQYVGQNVTDFLAQHQLQLTDIKNIISHPGGPKVLKALAEVLKCEDYMFRHSWQSLSEQGNMSSVSVLNVLERTLKDAQLKMGPSLGLAMGPAFNSEVSLFQVEKTS